MATTPEVDPFAVRTAHPIVEHVMVKGPEGRPIAVHPDLVRDLPHIYIPIDAPNSAPETTGARAPETPATGEKKEA